MTRPSVVEGRAVLASVKGEAPARRCCASPLTEVARGALRDQAGTEKRPFLPNRETVSRQRALPAATLKAWCMHSAFISFVFLFSISFDLCRAATPPLPTKSALDVSELTPMPLKPGQNMVVFYGMQIRYKPQAGSPIPFDLKKPYQVGVQQPGLIFEAQLYWRVPINSYFVIIPWNSPAMLVQFNTPDGSTKFMADEPTRGAGDDQSVLFFQGDFQGHRQTFLVQATRQYRLATLKNLKNGSIDFPDDSLPVKISIFAFSAGNPSDYDAILSTDLTEPPEFRLLEAFQPSRRYCSSYNAIAFELQRNFAPVVAKRFLSFADGTPRRDSLACSGDED